MDPVPTLSPLAPEVLATFGALFSAHLAYVVRVAWRIGATSAEVDDIAQETFLALLEAMAAGRYDPSQPARPWLRATAYRIGRRRMRKRAPLVFLGDAEPIDPAAMEAIMTAEHPAEVRQRWASAMELLGGLEPERRIVYVMAELEDMTAAEIGEVLEIPAKTVSTRLGLARRDVAAALARKRARERRALGELGAVVLPLDAAALIRPLRDLPAPEVSAEQRARIWRRLQVAITALPVPVQSVPPVPWRAAPVAPPWPSASPLPSLLRTGPRRMAVAVLLFVVGVAVGLLVALLTFLRLPPAPTPSMVVYTSAPVETAARMPGATLPPGVPSARPSGPPRVSESMPTERGTPHRPPEARFLAVARAALRRTPPDTAAALQHLAERDRLYGATTELAGEAAALRRDVEAMVRASPETKP